MSEQLTGVNVHISAHVALWLRATVSTAVSDAEIIEEIETISTDFHLIEYSNKRSMIIKNFAEYLKIYAMVNQRKHKGANDITHDYVLSWCADHVPGYYIPKDDESKSSVANVVPTNLSTDTLLALLASNPRYLFYPQAPPEFMAEEVTLSGTIRFGTPDKPVMNIREIALELMTLFGLTTIQRMRDGQMQSWGKTLQQNRRSIVEPGVLTGLVEGYDRRYAILFGMGVDNNGSYAKIAQGVMPHGHLPDIPIEGLVVKRRIACFPRNSLPMTEFMHKLFTWDSLAYVTIAASQLDKGITITVNPVTGTSSKLVTINVLYETQRTVISGYEKAPEVELNIALALVMYAHTIPTWGFPMYYEELVVIADWAYDWTKIDLRKTQHRPNSMPYDKQSLITMEDGVLSITPGKIKRNDPVLNYLGLTVVADTLLLHGEPVSEHRAILGHVYTDAPDTGKKTTTVTRSYSRYGKVANASAVVTTVLSSAALHSPYLNTTIDSIGDPIMMQYITSVLFVRLQQTPEGSLVFVMASYKAMRYSRKYNRIMVYRPKMPSHIAWNHHTSMGTEGKMHGFVSTTPSKMDFWYNYDDPNVGPGTAIHTNTYKPKVKRSYTTVIVNQPGLPYMVFGNLELRANRTVGGPIVLQRNRAVEGVLDLPMIKAVATPASITPDSVPDTPDTLAKKRERKLARPGIPGTSGVVHFDGMSLALYYTPKSHSAIHAVTLQLDPQYVPAWIDLGNTHYDDFGKHLYDMLDITPPSLMENWFAHGVSSVLYEHFPMNTTAFTSDIRFDRIVDMLEWRYDVDLYMLVLNKKCSDYKLNMRTSRDHWYIVEREKGRLWERVGLSYFVWANTPLSHAHPRGDSYYTPAEIRSNQAAVLAAIDSIPQRATIPKKTRLIVLNNDGIPIIAYDKDMRLIANGPFVLRRQKNYRHYREAPGDVSTNDATKKRITLDNGTSGEPIFSRIPDDEYIYFAQYSERFIVGDNVYFSMEFYVNATKSASETLRLLTHAEPLGWTSNHTIPTRVSTRPSFKVDHRVYRKFYEQAGVLFGEDIEGAEDVDADDEESTQEFPTYLSMPHTFLTTGEADVHRYFEVQLPTQ